MNYPKNIFRAYDIRGKYPGEINESVATAIAGTLADYFSSQKRGRIKVIIGHDARKSSPKLYAAANLGLRRKNISLIKVGMITTPMLYFLVNYLRADGGIIVTASHNPKDFNGLKIVGKRITPISGVAVRKLMIKNKVWSI